MVRKSKQASGNATLTHHERRHKLATDHGTLERRLAGHAQYQLGECGLSLTPFTPSSVVLCSPSGYLYEDTAIVQYLVTQTQKLKQQQERADAAASAPPASSKDDTDANETTTATRKRKATFEASQRQQQQQQQRGKQHETTNAAASQKEDLKRTSYWLADSQPVLTESTPRRAISTRPLSPHSQQPLRRKDLWPVQIEYDTTTTTSDNVGGNGNAVICGLTGKPIRTQAAIAYWTDKNRQEPGKIVLLQDGYQQLIVQQQEQRKPKKESKKDTATKKPTYLCPRTNLKIQYTRTLQRSGSSFATSGQATVVQQYRPTMT